jgi:creatinine amidohydrolase
MKLLEEMSWPQIEAGLKETQTVILPVGATEEHGPHLPTMTDTIQAMEVARVVAKERHIFLAPPLHYGVCRSTRGFPAPSPWGTMPCVPSPGICSSPLPIAALPG